MPTEGTDFHGIDGFKAFSSHHPLSEIGNASTTFLFCVFRAFRGPLFQNLGWLAQKNQRPAPADLRQPITRLKSVQQSMTLGPPSI
jgi:hypothetical protein